MQDAIDAVALDAVKNEYVLHRGIHEYLAADSPALLDGVDGVIEWIYAEIFETPSSDPWLGLSSPDIFTAVEDDGRVGSVAGHE